MDLGIALDAPTIAWWVYLVVFWRLAKRSIGFSGLTTFTFFLPYLLLTNGFFVPVAPDLMFQLTGLDLTLTRYESYWWSLAVMYASLLVGIAVANGVSLPSAPARSLESATELAYPRSVRIYVFLVVALSAASLVQIYARGLNFNFLSYASLGMDYDAYAAHRYGFAEATKGLEFFLYNKLPYGIAPLAVIIVWNAKEFDGWKRAAFIAILAAALLQTGHKMPLIFLLAYMLMSRAAIARKFVIDRKLVRVALVLMALMLIVVLPAFYLLQGNDSYSDSLFWSVERVFMEQARGLQMHFEVWPDFQPFLHGASNATVANLMGVDNFVPPSVYIANEFLGIENTSFPALFIGEGWADFGYLGVALTSVIVGLILQLYNRWFYSLHRPSLEDCALFMSIGFGTYHLFASNLLTSFFSYGLVGNLVIYKLIQRTSKRAEASL